MEFNNPNISGEMANILTANQDRYVPKTSGDCDIDIQSIASKIPFHGDQLFDERARNVQWTFQDGDNYIDCLNGLTPEFADWHAKVTLYQVCILTLHYTSSMVVHDCTNRTCILLLILDGVGHVLQTGILWRAWNDESQHE